MDGHTTLEHSLPAAKLYDDVKQLWQQSETAYTPTLVVAYGGIWGENYWYDKTEVWKHPRLSQYVPMDELRPRAMRRPTAPLHHYNHFSIAKSAKELNDLGVLANIGAHGQRGKFRSTLGDLDVCPGGHEPASGAENRYY